MTVNGRTYRWMGQSLVVVCVDGCEFDYNMDIALNHLHSS